MKLGEKKNKHQLNAWRSENVSACALIYLENGSVITAQSREIACDQRHQCWCTFWKALLVLNGWVAVIWQAEKRIKKRKESKSPPWMSGGRVGGGARTVSMDSRILLSFSLFFFLDHWYRVPAYVKVDWTIFAPVASSCKRWLPPK